MLNILFSRSTHVVGILALVLSLGLFKNCNSTPPEYEAFYDQNWESQRQQAKTFPIEKQIEYYLAGRRYFHPPYHTLLYVIADRGKEALPPLIEKMKHADNDYVRMDLMEVVLNIHEFHVSLSDDKEVIDQLTVIVGSMTDPERKVKAEAMLREIIDNKRP